MSSAHKRVKTLFYFLLFDGTHNAYTDEKI